MAVVQSQLSPPKKKHELDACRLWIESYQVEYSSSDLYLEAPHTKLGPKQHISFQFQRLKLQHSALWVLGH